MELTPKERKFVVDLIENKLQHMGYAFEEPTFPACIAVLKKIGAVEEAKSWSYTARKERQEKKKR